MKYAVVEIKGKQYKVGEGEIFTVDYFEDKPSLKLLLLSDGDKVMVGKPELDSSLVKIKILDEKMKGEKLQVLKYKAKSRYRKKVGFRPVYTKLQVEKIGI